MKKAFSIFCFLFAFVTFHDCIAQSEILDDYIRSGLSNNLGIRGQKLKISESIFAQKETKRLFSPSLTFNARYTVTRGGREDELPIDQFLFIFDESAFQPGLSPSDLPTQTIAFLREREHETKLSLVLPLLDSRLIFNKRAKKELTKIELSKLNEEQRRLVANIKSSYYQYLITIEVLKVLEDTENLIEEQLRVTKSLVKNGKLTYNKVTRVEAEMADLESRITEAEKDSSLAAAYFNMLLGRPLTSEILIDENLSLSEEMLLSLEEATRQAKAKREEFEQIRIGIQANQQNVKLNKWEYSPKLILAADYGFQGVEYEFNKKQDFFIGSLVLRWTFFDGMAAQSKAAQAEIKSTQMKNQLLELQQMIELQVMEAYTEAKSAEKIKYSSEKKFKSASENYRFTSKQYEQNLANQIELIDAQSVQTRAGIEKVIANYNYLIALANFEYASASYKLRQ